MKRIALLGLAIAVLATSLAAQDTNDIKFELRSATGSNTFQLGEVIPIELVFSSSAPGRYLEPCMYLTLTCFGYPQCRFANQWKWTITPEEGWTDLQHSCAGMSGPTFIVPDDDLTAQPKVFAYELSQRFRFDKPGKYTVRFTLDIGLDDESNPRAKMDGPFGQPPKPGARHSVSVSAELPIEIVPANAEWQKEVISKGVAAYSGDEPPRTEPLTREFVQYKKDTTALCELGTPDAARALASLMLREHPRVAECLDRSPSRAAAILGMERLMSEPDVAITPAFFTELVTLRNLDDRNRTGFVFIEQHEIDLERQRLIDALPKKSAQAATTSLLAVLHNPPMSRPAPGQQKYPIPFPASVVNFTAAHLEEFPTQEQDWLLRDQWDLIRSPQLLPALRRLATSNGYALLRWQDLDRAAADEFARNEVLSPEPHFSSFFLRLSRPLTAAEQKQLAANFVAAVQHDLANRWYPGYNLVRVATLLHRYGTRDVLPTVLAVIDAHRNDWPCAISYPVLAYLLKVSPEKAAPRVEEAIAKANHGPCNTSFFFTELGFLEHGPVMEQLAFAQVSDQPGQFARDAAAYLRLYAPANAKARVWERMQYWHGRAARLPKQTVTQHLSAEEYQIQVLADELMNTFVRAQAWMVTPEDEGRLKSLLGEEGVRNQACTFACGSELSVSKPAQFAIYEGATERRYNEPPIMDYLSNPSPHRYAIRQYSSPNMESLEEKLLQFPTGSSFQFTWDFSARDRSEIIDIADFLRSHGYKVDNAQQWEFLAAK